MEHVHPQHQHRITTSCTPGFEGPWDEEEEAVGRGGGSRRGESRVRRGREEGGEKSEF